eukprot:15661863-Heterocapsa_arctica.AAC.1
MNKTKLKEMADLMSDFTMEEKCMHIRTCRLKKAYDPDKFKLVLAVRGQAGQYRTYIVGALRQVGAD